jgi:DNA-binding MarR family transcriptional regulator
MKDQNNSIQRTLEHLDRLVHEPARLMIMAYLYIIESGDFTFLSTQTGLTHGNLSSHMSKLESAGYIEVEKEFVDSKPHTMLKLTERGREAFRKYRRIMEGVFEDLPE